MTPETLHHAAAWLDGLAALAESLTGLIPLAVSLCAALSAITPPPGGQSGAALRGLRALIDLLGCNFGYAANRGPGREP